MVTTFVTNDGTVALLVGLHNDEFSIRGGCRRIAGLFEPLPMTRDCGNIEYVFVAPCARIWVNWFCASGDLLICLVIIPIGLRTNCADNVDDDDDDGDARIILSSDKILVCWVLRRLILFCIDVSASDVPLPTPKSSSEVSVSSVNLRFLSSMIPSFWERQQKKSIIIV